MWLPIFSLRGGSKAAAMFCCLLLLLLSRGAVADPPVNPRCRVFCFRITDIRCDEDVENRYHFEFEVLNWSDAFAGGVRLQLSTYSDFGVEFAGFDLDPDGRPLVWEDIDGDLALEGDADDLEDTNKNGILDDGEDKNGNSRLDNDSIPGNFGRSNHWNMISATPTELEWFVDFDEGGPLPFINLVDSRSCRKCIEGLPARDGPQLASIDPRTGDVDPLEYVDNGDNVQDGFVMTIDGLEPGKVAHINWYLLGAGRIRADPEPTPSGDCREGLTETEFGKPIGSINGGNAYGFGLVSLYRQVDDDEALPGGSFEGQTGFAQTGAEFFDSVYNVPGTKNGKFPECGKFGMEFTPGTTCEEAGDSIPESSCPPGVQSIPGQGAGVMPVIDGTISDGEWDGATVMPLWHDNNETKASLSTAYVKVNCVTNKWYVRTEINQEEGAIRMGSLPESQFIRVGGATGAFGDPVVDGNSRESDAGEAHFRWVVGENAEGKSVRVGWEACFKWSGSEQPPFLRIRTRVLTPFSPNKFGDVSGTAITTAPNKFDVCVCGGSVRGTGQDGRCKPIDTRCGGDPHFSTWSGEKFTFHGECDLVLIRNPAFADGLGMHVHGRTKIHEGWSDMESVAIRIGESDVFEARGAAEYWINGERNAQLPALVGGYQVSLQQSSARTGRLAYVLHLGGEKELRIKAWNKMMWVQIKGQQSSVFKGSDGLFGHYGNGQMMGRDGTVIEIANDYGQEWQVRPDLGDPALFHTLEGPQYPQKCKMPPVRSNLRSNNINNGKKDLMDDEGVRLAIAKKACAHAPKLEMDDCIYDVVATQNVDVAEAY